MKEIIVISGQTIYDIALQEYGSYQGIEFILEDNDDINLELDLIPGKLLQIREISDSEREPAELRVLKRYNTDLIKPSSGYSLEPLPELYVAIDYVIDDYVEEL